MNKIELFFETERLPSSLNSFKKICIDSIIIELDSRVQKNKDVLSFRLLELANSLKIHTFFSEACLSYLVDSIFNRTNQTDLDFRDFLLCLADRFCISIEGEIESNDKPNKDYLIENILTVNCKNNISVSNALTTNSCLLPYELKQKLYFSLSENAPIKVLKENDWLLVIFMLIICVRELTLLVRHLSNQDSV